LEDTTIVSGAPNEKVLAIGCAGAAGAAAAFSADLSLLSRDRSLFRVVASARALTSATAAAFLSASAFAPSAFAPSALRRDRSATAAWRDRSTSFASANVCVSRGVGVSAGVGGTTATAAGSREDRGVATDDEGVVSALSLT
jgi:hypothetical protein